MSSLSKTARFPLFILMLNLFIALLGQGMVIPILPEYLKLFNASGAAAGYLIAAFGAAQFIFSPMGDSFRINGKKINDHFRNVFNGTFRSDICCLYDIAPTLCR